MYLLECFEFFCSVFARKLHREQAMQCIKQWDVSAEHHVNESVMQFVHFQLKIQNVNSPVSVEKLMLLFSPLNRKFSECV